MGRWWTNRIGRGETPDTRRQGAGRRNRRAGGSPLGAGLAVRPSMALPERTANGSAGARGAGVAIRSGEDVDGG